MVDMTYVALRRLKVGGEIREEGDLVPEAKTWKTLRSSIAQNRIALVPRSTVDQDALREAEERYEAKLAERAKESEPESHTVPEVIAAIESGEMTADEALEQEINRPGGERKGVMEYLESLEEE